MADDTYNGWTNYATWRVNLEIFDGFDPEGFSDDIYELSKEIKDYAEELISTDSNDLTGSYAMAFINNVNWYEIAESLLEQ